MSYACFSDHQSGDCSADNSYGLITTSISSEVKSLFKEYCLEDNVVS